MNLIDRIDLALKHAGKSRRQLAEAIEVTTQAISNLKARPRAIMKPEHIAKAARFLRCDLYWLCTGEGDYLPEQICTTQWSYLATEIARWFEALPEEEQHRMFARIYQVCEVGTRLHGLPPPPRAQHTHHRRPAR